MKRCWASSLGNCDTMSGEHVFSNAILKAGCGCTPLVRGVQRIRNGEPTAGAEKANILCRHHNSMLSPLDEVAGGISAFQAKTSDENFTEAHYIEGELLERWLLKTVINSAVAGWMGPRKWHPLPEVVSAIFGRTSIPDGIGLYSVDGIDPSHKASGGVSAFPIFLDREQQFLGGAYVSINGMPLFASFEKELTSRLEQGDLPEISERFSPLGLKHLYHPGAIVTARKRGQPAVLGLSWKGLLHFDDGSTAPFPPL